MTVHVLENERHVITTRVNGTYTLYARPALLRVNGRLTAGLCRTDGPERGVWYPEQSMEPWDAWRFGQLLRDDDVGPIDLYEAGANGRAFSTLDELLRALNGEFDEFGNAEQHERFHQLARDPGFNGDRFDNERHTTLDRALGTHRDLLPCANVLFKLFEWLEPNHADVANLAEWIDKQKYEPDELAWHQRLRQKIRNARRHRSGAPVA